jgi:hypothetical protein
MPAKLNNKAKPNNEWFQIESLAAIREKTPHPDPEVIKGILQIGDACNIVAASKLGKSYFVAQLVVSFIAGQEWFGHHFGPVKKSVLIIDNELKTFEILARLERVARAMNVDPALLDSHVQVLSLRGKRKSIHEIQLELSKVPPGTYSLIILDSNYRAYGKANEANPSDMADFYEVLTNIAGHARAAVIGVHHATKGNQAEKEVIDVGSGSGVIGRAVDGQIALRHHEEDECIVMEFKLRNYKSPDAIVLRRKFPVWEIDVALNPSKLRTANNSKLSLSILIEVIRQHGFEERMQRHDLSQALQDHTNCGKRTADDFIRDCTQNGKLVQHPDGRTYKVSLAPHILAGLADEFETAHPAGQPPATVHDDVNSIL